MAKGMGEHRDRSVSFLKAVSLRILGYPRQAVCRRTREAPFFCHSYARHMLDRVVDMTDQGATPVQRAEKQLEDGIPLGLTATSAAQFSAQCQMLLDEMGPRDCLLAVKLRAGQVIVPAALHATHDRPNPSSS